MILLMLFNLILSYIAFYKRTLSVSGAFSAALLGIGIIWGTGLLGYCLMGAFFVSSSVLTKFSVHKNKGLKLHELHEKMDLRDYTQVFSNGLIPLCFALLYGYFHHLPFLIAYVTALAVACADTWASEIGVLSKKPPKTIIGRKLLRPGLSGGITPLGLLASVMGAGFIGTFYGFMLCIRQYLETSLKTLLTYHFIAELFLTVVMVTGLGFLGALLDSLLGELFQAKFKTKDLDGLVTEKVFSVNASTNVVEKNELISGFFWFSNNLVNLLSITLTSFLSLFIANLLFKFL